MTSYDTLLGLQCIPLYHIAIFAHRYKVQGIVKDIPTRIIDYIRPGPYRLNWDSLMTSMDIVKTFDEVNLQFIFFRKFVLFFFFIIVFQIVLRQHVESPQKILNTTQQMYIKTCNKLKAGEGQRKRSNGVSVKINKIISRIKLCLRKEKHYYRPSSPQASCCKTTIW